VSRRSALTLRSRFLGTSQAFVQMTMLILIDTFGSVLMENKLDVRNVQHTSHHAGALSCWLAGTGAKQAMVSEETDDDGMKGTKTPIRTMIFKLRTCIFRE
jgi:hypothetical protein